VNGRITHTSDDGVTHDVTEAVKCLYDLVLDSMDWGSGFWSVEEAVPIGILARLCQFEKADEVERYLGNREKWQKYMDQLDGLEEI
jgi:hypothetical protein